MYLEPYVRVNDILFIASRDELVRVYGSPRSEVRSAIGLTALDYGDILYRFQDCGRLEEVTQQASVLSLGSVMIPFVYLAGFVRAQEAGAFERAGFLVSPHLGIAFVPEEPCWITALAQHCLPQWEALAG
jgi:hypothetical protein